MVSLRAKLVIGIMKTFLNFNSTRHPNKMNKVKNSSRKNAKPIYKRGYTLTFKETEKKSKYYILKKDNAKETKKIIYYIHGGAYVMGLSFNYYNFAYPLCDLREDIEVVLLDYSLAPEAQFPTQLEETYDVWNEITKKISPENIIIGGDSAGGNASLALIQKLKDEKKELPKGGIFLSPWTDMTCSGKSYYDNYQKDILFGDSRHPLTEEIHKKMINGFSSGFVGNADRKNPYVSPVYADYSTFLSKSLFIVSSNEILLDDTLTIVNQLKENKIEVELLVKEGMFHAYPISKGFFPEANEAYEIIKKFIVDTF